MRDGMEKNESSAVVEYKEGGGLEWVGGLSRAGFRLAWLLVLVPSSALVRVTLPLALIDDAYY